ncbi:hypothetical protein RAB80_010311 [Fusarium oxysporum f. sp. vasinfectum]|uniref:Rhodopsin domain-containing protein n=1 Tax=Fusarium oxysporum f. sp. vasinfectum 25433 TaxID=1089449 RepID=X0L3Z3_FUSOX|nr:hypothetical protein FOTG_11435 [Fusarium oxysporum f. sp. vasinfectum 25433]KAK2672768.1 hypothetical protein RAB80_010311 [Fusarium oxysporum f. sp. vasinfectum]KAK2929182.1 hypothetical protein FoTM2_009521 [Fusarium oxysporum f. sp. vasinfectum]
MESNAHLPHSSLGPRALGIVTPFLIVGILVFTVRIYTRVTPVYKLDASDYTISVAVIIEVIVYSLFIASVTSGLGRYSYDVSPEQGVKTLRYVYVVILLSTFVPALVRISVGFLLLKFVLSKAWRAIIWCTIGIQAACAISTEIFQLIQCRPINAQWEQVPDARCLSARQIWICGYTTIGVALFGDLALAVMPMFIIWKLNRSTLERCLISVLMALGLVATVTVIMRLVEMRTLDFASPERFRTLIPVYFWLRMEEAILIIASSAPMLKSPIEHFLHKFGLPVFQPRVRKMTSFHSSNPVSDTTPRLHHQRSQQELVGYKQPIFMHEPQLEGAEEPPSISNDIRPLSDISQALTR